MPDILVRPALGIMQVVTDLNAQTAQHANSAELTDIRNALDALTRKMEAEISDNLSKIIENVHELCKSSESKPKPAETLRNMNVCLLSLWKKASTTDCKEVYIIKNLVHDIHAWLIVEHFALRRVFN